MHETHLFKRVLIYLKQEEKKSSARIRKIHVSLSEFGGLSEEHFREHFREAAAGTPLEVARFKFRKIPFGPEFEITKIEFYKK